MFRSSTAVTVRAYVAYEGISDSTPWLLVDLAALRSAMERLGGDPAKVEPGVPVDLVIDHSVQVDAYGNAAAMPSTRGW